VEASFPQVRLLRSGANLGFARANNLGIRQSRGRLVGLVNSDVTVLPECLDRLVEFMDAHPRVGMAGPEVLNPDGSLQNSHWDFPSVGGMLARVAALDTVARKINFKSQISNFKFQISNHNTNTNTNAKANSNPNANSSVLPVDVLSGCFMVLQREALERVGLLDEDFYIYGEDMDLCRRFHAAGWEVVYYTGARAIHAGGASSANAPVRFFIELQKANLQYWTKHHGRVGGLFFKGATLIQHLLRLAGSGIIYSFVPHLRPVTRQKIQRSAKCIEWLLRRAPAMDSGTAGQPAVKKEESTTGLGARNR
jgi:GT2 family glycosyltransferase